MYITVRFQETNFIINIAHSSAQQPCHWAMLLEPAECMTVPPFGPQTCVKVKRTSQSSLLEATIMDQIWPILIHHPYDAGPTADHPSMIGPAGSPRSTVLTDRGHHQQAGRLLMYRATRKPGKFAGDRWITCTCHCSRSSSIKGTACFPERLTARGIYKELLRNSDCYAIMNFYLKKNRQHSWLTVRTAQ